MEQEKNNQPQAEQSAPYTKDTRATTFLSGHLRNQPSRGNDRKYVNRTLIAAQRLKGSLIVNDPAFLL